MELYASTDESTSNEDSSDGEDDCLNTAADFIKDNSKKLTVKNPSKVLKNNDPLWWAESGFQKFKKKVLAVDPHAEFDRKNRNIVQCGRCGKMSEAKKVNNLLCFKEHFNGKNCQNGKGNQPLVSSFFLNPQKKASGSRRLRPKMLPLVAPGIACPGLGEINHHHVPKYLARTVMGYGGARHRSVIQDLVTTDPGSFSLGKNRKKITKEDIDACVLRTERAEASKFTLFAYCNKLLGDAYARHTDFQELMQMGKEKWLVFAKRAAAGRYDYKHPALCGMLQAITISEDRSHKGKSLKNMKYDADFDIICTNLALISPQAYKIIQAEFGGRSLRSMRYLRAKGGRYQPGIVESNFDAAQKWLADMGYDGPVVLAVDDTKVTAALRSYRDGDKWKAGGMHGEVKAITQYDDLLDMAHIDRKSLAEKTRAWLLVVPIAKIPPKLIATVALANSVNRDELHKWHADVESHLASRSIHHISYNVDGVSIERGLTHDIQNKAIKNKATHKWIFQHPIRELPNLVLEVPVLENGKPRAMSTDGKNLKKNGRGSAISGACVRPAGRYIIHYGMFATLALSKNSPLLKSDIIGIDKQDDRAAARLFSSAVVEHISRTQPDELGMIIYLFIIGEIIDAQQNRSITHDERIKMLWRGRFFLDGWRDYVLAHPHYSINTHFITRELYNIISIYIGAMLMLILTHRDFFPATPLLLWLHSTEVCEHFFGCACKIQSDFTFVDWILMIPKLTLLMMGETQHKGTQAQPNVHRSGYNHSWYDSKGVDVKNLKTFPTDEKIQELIDVAFSEATALLNILGIDHHCSDGSIKEMAPRLKDFLDNLHKPDAEATMNSTLSANDSGSSDLDAMMAADAIDSLTTDGIGSSQFDKKMTDLGVASVATAIHDSLKIDALPEDGQDEKNDWKNTITDLATALIEAYDLAGQANDTNTPLVDGRASKNASGCKLPPQCAIKPLDFGTSSSFRHSVLVKERAFHETEEARSAITYRYRNAAGVSDVLEQVRSSQGSEPSISSKLKASVVTEITRVVSASLTSTAKADTAGIERLVCWRGLGVVAMQEAEGNGDEPLIGNGDSIAEASSAVTLESLIALINGGISPFSPLIPGSWVLVMVQSRIWLAKVQILYLKGRGKKPSHNYAESCNEISSLSRLVVQLYQQFGEDLLSPLILKPSNSFRQAPSFPFLHSESLITCLDVHCPQPVELSVKIEHNLQMLKQSEPLKRIWAKVLPFHAEIIQEATAIIKAAGARPKRTKPDDSRLDEEEPVSKKKKTK
ncbi:hypothetical protein H0H81_007102 [Sphagnurus paluster]|uniref:Uncharacterized protein n=1 Tax=Sphagnurus paluster TaxID=117069 RepID=A0A9P7K6D6_9AGAR|nr:hypothetical protein H0H81_007102 [Sphagnurus paluster]